MLAAGAAACLWAPGGHALASSPVVDGRYRFEDVDVPGAGFEAVLRVCVSPIHFLERPLLVGPGADDLGTLELGPVLAEFNRLGSEVFQVSSK